MTESNVLTDANLALTLEEISSLAQDGNKPADTLMNVVALIAKRFQADACSAYLLEPDRSNLVLAATVGLRPNCIGTLRMPIHKGLTGLVAVPVAFVLIRRAEMSKAVASAQQPKVAVAVAVD